MKRCLVAVAVCVLVVGCDFSVPLLTGPKKDIDQRLVGLWRTTTAQGEEQRLLVLPLSENEYMISYPAGEQNAAYAKAILGTVGGKDVAQLEWFGTAKGTPPPTDRHFQVVAYSLAEDGLDVRLLNGDTVGHDAETPAALARSVERHAADPDLYREPAEFERIED